MPTVLVATDEGLRAFDDGGPARTDLPDRPVTWVTRARTETWAIVDGSEIWRSENAEWRHVADVGRVRATCLAAIGDDLFVGSAQAHLFRFDGQRLESVEGFDEAEGRDGWYTPWGGPPDTRSIANWDDDTYVNVHVGGILRSDDDAKTWSPTIDVDADVHQVTTADEGAVLAACAGGLATSKDRGSTWSFRTDGLDSAYSRAVAVCGDTVLVSASRGPRGGGAALYRGDIGDGPFERCDLGAGWFEGNIDTAWLDALPEEAFAAVGTPDGSLFVSEDAGATWEERAWELGSISRVLVMP